MTAQTDGQLSGGDDQALRVLFRGAPDPAFLARLRRESRARHARLHHNLGWFDLKLDIGPLRIVHDGELIHLVTNAPNSFREYAGERLGYVPEHGEHERVREEVAEALAGRVPGSKVTYLGDLPAFQRQVLEATAAIPRGEVRPYAWVARAAGKPGAVRAAGTALAHNPVPFVVPCHRVVKSDFELGNYSAAGGPATKERVLRYEGLELERLAELRAQGIRYLGHGGEAFCFPGCGGTWEPVDDYRTFRTAAEAIALGYEPCDACKPV